MKSLRLMAVAGVAALGSFGIAPSTAQAQYPGRVVATYPRTYVVPGTAYRPTRQPPTYRRYAPRYTSPRVVIMPHSFHDWSTGKENLPLAKPWLYSTR